MFHLNICKCSLEKLKVKARQQRANSHEQFRMSNTSISRLAQSNTEVMTSNLLYPHTLSCAFAESHLIPIYPMFTKPPFWLEYVRFGEDGWVCED